MTTAVFLAVLAAAVMHASWNAMIKVRLDRFASISLMSVGTGVFALPFLFFVEVPEGITWLWIVLSLAMHTGYRGFLVRAYETGDLAQTYPLARGTAPLLTTLGGIFLLQEAPGPVALLGIAVLSLGTLLMSWRGGHEGIGGRAVFYALVTSLFICGYTLSDGSGARSAATATSYAAWLFFLDGIWVTIVGLAVRGQRIVREIRGEWLTGLITGVLSGVAYWIAMWAMTKAPVAAVAALRESSILFAMLISVMFLGERMTRWRLVAAFAIVLGVVALRLG